jgi:hypothetical protein
MVEGEQMIGPHCEKMAKQRRYMESMGYPVCQTHFGNPQSFDIPREMHAHYAEGGPERWVWHAAFISSANPGEKSRDGCAVYLREVIRLAAKFRISDIVVHTGTVSGVPVERVLEGMERFLREEGIAAELGRAKTRLAVELGASTCGLNLNPQLFAERFRGDPNIGWCLDLAHSYAAGCTWKTLLEAIRIQPPFVCHANFPGSSFGSSRDIHGWRTLPHLEKQGRATAQRMERTIDHLTEHFDMTIRMLHSAGVPLIVEGSQFPGCSTQVEMGTIRDIVAVQPPGELDGNTDEGRDHIRSGG